MNSSIAKKTAALALALLLAIPSVISCASSSGNETTESSSSAETSAQAESSEETVTTAEERLAGPEVRNLDGYEYRIYVPNVSTIQFYDSEELNGDMWNDSVYNRCRAVEDAYNCSVTQIIDKSAASTVKKGVAAGDDICDITTAGTADSFSLARAGYLYDITELSNIDLSAVWWDQALTEQLSVTGRVFFITGDITVADDNATFVIMYNKDMYANLGYSDPYALVSDGTWTFDRLWEFSQGASMDTDGDGVMTEADTIGLISEYSAAFYMFKGSGRTPLTINKDGSYQLNTTGEDVYNVLSKILVMGTDNTTCMICDNGKWTGDYSTAGTMFRGGQGLFRTTTLGVISNMREMEYDFGVLPIPKYDEAQDKYYSLVSWGNQAISVPVSLADPDSSSLVTEALAYESHYGMRDDFYEVLLGSKLIRDTQSKDMLDIIFASKCYDIDYNAKLTGFFDIITEAVRTGSTEVSSKIEAGSEKAQANVEKFIGEITSF